MGRPKSRPRRQFSPSKAKAPQTCYTAIMNLTQCPPNIPITPTMSTCSEKRPAQCPPAAPPTGCAAATGKKSTRASHGAPTPPCATAAAKNATTAAKPAPPAAQKTTCAANAHLDLPSKNQSHRLCRPLCRKLCRKHQNAPFSQKLCLIFKKNRNKTSPYLSCHDRSHQYPVTEQKILAKYQHLLTSFAAIRYPFDTLPVCPQPPAMEAAASRPGHSRARPAPPSPRAAAPTPPCATAAAKNAATTTMPAPPAAQKITCAANAHLYRPSKNQSHRLCRKLCRKHQNASFSQKLPAFFKENRDKTSPYLSCHDRAHQYPVTEQKILAKNQHLLTTFAAIRYPFDTLPVCPQPPTLDAAASRPGHSRARPAPPSPRAAAPTPPCATAAAKNAATTTMPAPPAAQKITCAANAHLYRPSKNQSHRLCRKLCRKHQNASFSQKLPAFFKENRDKTSPYLSCHDRAHQYPVTEQKILAKYQHLLTTFAAIRYPFDTLPVCPQPPAMEAAASRPGHSRARPAPPSPRAAAEELVSIINDRMAC